ncbi:MAG: phasin family protein [Pseudomonadota bacterium]|nr:phasin family protein [Pseudomonadota bacterium]
MTDETQVAVQDQVEAPAKAETAVIAAPAAPANDAIKTAKRGRPAGSRNGTGRKSKRKSAAPKAAVRKYVRKATAKRTTAARKINVALKSAAAQERKTIMKTTNNLFNGFDSIPAFTPFQSMFSQAGERSQDVAKKSQKVAAELADLTRANVEAIVEASRVAAEGARSIGQDVVATGRDGVAQASAAIRSLAEAKSPTEYMQLQGEFARASFDRMVAEGSKLTETMVKLAGEAFQPLQNRASANAERFNTLVA